MKKDYLDWQSAQIVDKDKIRISWPEIQNLQELEGFIDNSIPTDNTGEYLINKDWYESNRINDR